MTLEVASADLPQASISQLGGKHLARAETRPNRILGQEHKNQIKENMVKKTLTYPTPPLAYRILLYDLMHSQMILGKWAMSALNPATGCKEHSEEQGSWRPAHPVCIAQGL